jgi:hypothetical protein
MAHAIVRLDKVRSAYVGHLYDVVHSADMDNGNVVKIGTNVTGQRDLFNVTVPSAGDGSLYLVASPEIIYDQTTTKAGALENFYIPAGTAARVYDIARGDIFSVTYDGLTLLGTDAVKGNFVVAQAGLKLKEATSTTTEKFVGKIIDVEVLGTTTLIGQAGSIARINKYVVIQVVKNEA